MYQILIIFILAVYLLALAILSLVLLYLRKTRKKLARKAKDRTKDKSQEYAKKFQNRYMSFAIHSFFKNIFLAASLDKTYQLSPLTKIYFKSIDILYILYSIPIILIQLYIIMLRPTVSKKLPASLFDLWYFLLVLLSYSLAEAGRTTSSIIIACLNICFALNRCLEYFSPDKKGVQKIITMPTYKFKIFTIVSSWSMIILSYASIYFAIYRISTNSFKGIKGFFDSIYFSITTITTLGYGDIIPLSKWAKFIVMTEVFLGFIFVIIILAMYLSVYAARVLSNNKIEKS